MEMTAVTGVLRDVLSTPVEREGFPVMAGFRPAIGHALTLHRDAVRALQRASREQGPFVWVSLGFGQWYLFCFGTETFDLLRSKAAGVAGSRARLKYLIGDSLLASDGAAHRRMRSAMNPTFTARGLAEAGAGRVSAETVERHVRELVAAGGGDMHARMQAMALDVIFRIVGVEVESLSNWHAAYRRLMWGLVPVPFEWPGTPRYFALRAAEWINGELRAMVRRARGGEAEASLMHALVHAKDDEGQPLSEEELIDNLRLLFIAGHETTATTMTFATTHLAQRPDLMKRLQEEVEAFGPGAPLTLADAKRLPLCEGVFREAARLYTPAWFIERRLSEAVTVRGTTIPAGTTIALSPPLWGRDPALYPEPERFNPDRWLGKSAAPTPLEMSAFGGGVHFCIGYHLSWLESVQYLSLLARALSEGKKRLRLATARPPEVAVFPLPRPTPKALVAVEPA